MAKPGTITRAVNAVGVRSVDADFPRVYEELRKLAARHLGQERREGRLDATVLVHAAYEKLFGGGNPGWENRRHFYGTAASAMRQILIDQARKRKTRREVLMGPHPATALVFGFSEWGPDELLALDEALNELEKMDPRLSEVIRLRIFAEQSLTQVAELTGLSVRQTSRDWRAAKAWLFRRLQGKDIGAEDGAMARAPKDGKPPKQGGNGRAV